MVHKLQFGLCPIYLLIGMWFQGIEARNVVITESVETPADDVAAPRKRRQRRRSLVAADDHQESSEKTATGECMFFVFVEF